MMITYVERIQTTERFSTTLANVGLGPRSMQCLMSSVRQVMSPEHVIANRSGHGTIAYVHDRRLLTCNHAVSQTLSYNPDTRTHMGALRYAIVNDLAPTYA